MLITVSVAAAVDTDAVVLVITEDTTELVTAEDTVEHGTAVTTTELVTAADTVTLVTPSCSSSSELGCVVTSSDDIVTAEGVLDDGDEETKSMVAR